MLLTSPLVALFFLGLANMTRLRQSLPVPHGWLVDLVVGLGVSWKLPQPSIVPFWGLLTSLVARGWPWIVNADNNNASMTIRILARGGPLGRGCKKFVEVLVAIGLWRFVHQKWPNISLGQPLPGVAEWMGIFVLAAAVNLVLQVWSNMMQSSGNHQGVNDMVESTQNRKLSASEHLQILALAMINAACEEITSRWFWRREFATYLPPPHSSSGNNDESLSIWQRQDHYSNLAQATLFGVWHYHGIPSGWTGVGLTFVYGYIMGFLQDYENGGLILPIVAHGIADYYIFAFIARRKKDTRNAKKKS